MLPAVASHTTQHRQAEMARNMASSRYFIFTP
nr:MAG TPA: hypothetical protein [Caudoviricetes sp.]